MEPINSHLSAVAAIDIDFQRRFGGVARLYGAAALERFQHAHVCVIGVGGVGSWIVEALVRSAIGRITMIDLDNVAESNINRQIHALTDTVGKAKVTALSERIAQINPFCQVTEIEDFITSDNLDEMIGARHFDYVIDAIDNARAKAALIAYCRERGIRMITIGSAGGQTDPTRIEVRDLTRTEQEPLLARVRKLLRNNYGFSRSIKTKFGIEAVFSTEPVRMPESAAACTIGTQTDQGVTGLNCAGFGSAMVVTASFGLAAAAQVLRHLAQDAAASPEKQSDASTDKSDMPLAKNNAAASSEQDDTVAA
jgi:tRNA A37 threonylcarbamoyladenosine dehydratase